MHISELPAVKLLFAAQNKEVLFKEKSTWGEDGSKSFLNWILTSTSCVSAITQWSSEVSADTHTHTQADKQTCIVACPSDLQVLSLLPHWGWTQHRVPWAWHLLHNRGQCPCLSITGGKVWVSSEQPERLLQQPSRAPGELWEERQAGTGTGLAQGQCWQPASTACPSSCSWTASTQPWPGVPMAPQARHKVSEHWMAWRCLCQPFSCDSGVPSPSQHSSQIHGSAIVEMIQ